MAPDYWGNLMKYYTYADQDQYPIAILVPKIKHADIKRLYLDPHGLAAENVIIMDLHQSAGKKKTPAAEMKEYLSTEIQPELDALGVQYVIVGDADYYKTLTKSTKADLMIGYVVDSAFGSQKAIYVPNYTSVFYDPEDKKAKIKRSIDALEDYVEGNYEQPGSKIIHF